MTESDWIALISVAETALLLAAVVAIMTVLMTRRRKRDRRAADKLVDRLLAGAEQRRGVIRQRLTDDRGLETNQARDAAARIVAAEHSFSDRLIKTYLRRDADSLSRMDERLHELGNVYENIPLPAPPASEPEREPGETAPEGAEDEHPDLQQMRRTAEQLTDEVSLYRDALNRVFGEYTAMFGVEIDRSAQLTASEVINRLNSGELGDPGSKSEQIGNGPDDDDPEAPDEETDRLLRDL